MPDKRTKVPRKTKADHTHQLTRAMLAAVPIVGGTFAELFSLVIQPPLERRRAEWIEGVDRLLQELQEEGIDLDKLRDNEEFTSVVMHASQIAVRNHQMSKRQALRNALKSVARGQSPEDALQHLFLDLIDTLSELHIRVLRVFQYPQAPPGMSMGGLGNVLECAIPELRGRRDVYDQFWRDLYLRGLLNTEHAHVTMSAQGLGQRRTTALGDAFLAFITDT